MVVRALSGSFHGTPGQVDSPSVRCRGKNYMSRARARLRDVACYVSTPKLVSIGLHPCWKRLYVRMSAKSGVMAGVAAGAAASIWAPETVAARWILSLPDSNTLVIAATTWGSNLVLASELMMRITYSTSIAA